MVTSTRLERWMAPRLSSRRRHTAAVMEEVRGPDDSLGVPTRTWVATGATFKVYRQRSDGNEADGEVGKQPTSRWLMFGPVDPPCNTDNRLVILGATYEIDDINPTVDTARFDSHSEIRCHVVTPAMAG